MQWQYKEVREGETVGMNMEQINSWGLGGWIFCGQIRQAQTNVKSGVHFDTNFNVYRKEKK